MKSHFAITIIAVSSYFISGSSLQAVIYTISGTGLFDQNLGELTSVDVLIEPPEATLTETGSHQHTFNPSNFIATNTNTGNPYGNGTTIDFSPITLSLGGSHSSSVDVSPFSTSMGTINFPVGTTTTDGAHSQTINFGISTVGASASGQLDLAITATNSTGLHSHTMTIPSFSQSFSGSQIAPFLSGTPNATIDPPNAISSSDGFHAHQLAGGSYQAIINGSSLEFVTIPTSFVSSISGGQTHSMDIEAFDVTITTFYYTAVPEPSSTFLLVLGGLALVIRRSRP